MDAVQAARYNFDLPKLDDCWHLDPPHDVTITRKARDDVPDTGARSRTGKSGASEVIDQYRRVGINARAAWALEAEGQGVTVVIFDTGVDYTHPSLRPNIEPILDQAADFDHVFGSGGRTLAQNGRIVNSYNAHGTACAGLVAAVDPQRSNDKQVKSCRVVGVAPRALLLPIRISANFSTGSLINALRYARERGDVILLPRFLPQGDEAPGAEELTAELSYIAREIPVVCAAGNDGTSRLVHPASMRETIAVGACNDRGYRSTYSQYGEGLDIVAPSNDVMVDDRSQVRLDTDEVDLRQRETRELAARLAAEPLPVDMPQGLRLVRGVFSTDKSNLFQMGLLSIATTDNQGDFGYNTEPAGNYCKATGDFGFGGTSAAAAQVAGVIALILSANPDLKGKPEEIRRILRDTANTDPETLKPEPPRGAPPLTAETRDARFREEFGYGLVDAAAAVAPAKKRAGK